MSLSDPIGDMIARVKNAQARNHKKVELPSSNFKNKIANILKKVMLLFCDFSLVHFLFLLSYLLSGHLNS